MTEGTMNSLGRIGIWIAFLLLVLAGTSWAGLMFVSPLFFLVPAFVIFGLVAIMTMLPRARLTTPTKTP
jgi:hypothetical protein